MLPPSPSERWRGPGETSVTSVENPPYPRAMPTDHDPRIVDLYDQDNPPGPVDTLVLALADRRGPRRILDPGCGTGALTVRLAGPGRTVIGADPSATMIDHARRRPGAEAVTWIHGDADAVLTDPVDLVLMTGHVVEHLEDPAWHRTLRALGRLLADGGRLVFDSRNPAARAWETWRQEVPTIRPTMHGPLRERTEIDALDGGRVRARFHNVFERSGDHVVQAETFVFRDLGRLTGDLEDAGFAVVSPVGDHSGVPFDGLQRELVIEAARVC